MPEMADTPAPAAPSAPPSAEELPLRPLRHHLALTIYWLANTLMWGVLLNIGVQSRLGDWFAETEKGYYLGLLGFSGAIIGTVAQIVAGAFSDRSVNRWGRRRPYMVVGSAVTIPALLLLGGSRSFWPFAGALMLVQLSTNVALGPFSALLPDTVNPREHGKASGFMGVARLAGDTGGLLLAGVLLSASAAVKRAGAAAVVAFHDQRMLLLSWIMSSFTVVALVLSCLTLKEQPLRRRPAASVRQIILGSFALKLHGNRDFYWLCLSRAVTNIGFYMFLGVLLFFFQDTLKDPAPEFAAVLIILVATVAAVATSIPSGTLSDRIGRRPMLFTAQFVMAAGALLFVLAQGRSLAIVAAIPAGFAYGIFTAVEWAFACNLLPPGESARYLGIWNASAVLPQALALPLGGVLGSAVAARHPGLGWRLDFALAAGCCLLGAYFLVHVRERARDAARG
jgi:MFS family permease